MSQNYKNLPETNMSQAFYRLIGGIGSGLSGAIFMGIILFLSWSIVGDILTKPMTLSQKDPHLFMDALPKANSLFIGIIIIAAFLGSLLSNLVACIIFSSLDAKYESKSTVITHTFSGNLLILFIFIPIYFIANNLFGPTGVSITALVHIVLSGFFTFFVLEILSISSYIFLSLYASTVGFIGFFLWILILGKLNPSILVFVILPLFWGNIGFASGLVETIYSWFSKNYGDLLDTEKRYGSDSIASNYEDVDPEYDDL